MMKWLVLSIASVSIAYAAGGAAPGSAKAWEQEQARRDAVSHFDSASLNGPHPTTEFQFGTEQAWFSDWDLSTDRSPSGPKDKSALRRGAPRFLGIFDERGWIAELRYYDMHGNQRWSRIFNYPVVPKGTPKDAAVAYTAAFYDPSGEPLDRDAAEKLARENGRGWTPGHTRFEVQDALGEALIIFPTADGGETWSYFDGKQELKFNFSKQGKLVSSPARQ
jgi:hypothetical protein